jgi:hypothetical protein
MSEEELAQHVAAMKVAAREALGAGRWEEAREGFVAVLEIEESGEALFGLALAQWWLGDPVSSISLQQRAFGTFRRDGDYENAFFAAMYLCLGYDMTFGNSAPHGAGWLRPHGLSRTAGWLSFKVGCCFARP